MICALFDGHALSLGYRLQVRRGIFIRARSRRKADEVARVRVVSLCLIDVVSFVSLMLVTAQASALMCMFSVQ